MLCTSTNCPCSYGWKASKHNRNKQWDPDSIKAVGIIWWIQAPSGNGPTLRQRRICEALRHTQTKLHLGVAATLTTLVWGPNIFGCKTCIPTVLRPLAHSGKNMHGGLNNTGPPDRKGELGAGLGIPEQAEFAFNEEQRSEEKDLLTRIGRLDRILF